jgi:DNA repair ATPase RecN
MSALETRPVIRSASVCAALVLALCCHSARSQTERSGGGVSTQFYQQYQQAVSERNDLKAANEKQKSELDAVQKQLADLKRELTEAKTATATTQGSLAAAQSARDASAKSYEALKAQTQDLIQHFRDTVTNLRSIEAERTQLGQQLEQSKAAFNQCVVDNYELYKVDGEVLDRYAHQGTFSYMARAEPFTRIERNRIDNLVLEYRERAEALRVPAKKDNGTAAAAGAKNDGKKP